MIIDHCPVRPKVEFTNVHLVFLPPSTINHTQPMDSGIIKNLKFHYRHSLVLRRLEAAKDEEFSFTWNLLDSVIALKSASKRVKINIVANCFKKADFIVEEAHVLPEDKLEGACTNCKKILNPQS